MKIIGDLPADSAEWQADFAAALDENGQWTATQSFKCRPQDVLNLIPARGDDCQEDGFEILKFISAQVVETKGDGWRQVVCNYRGTIYDFNEDDPASIEPTYNTSVVAQSEPIESHPNFKDLSAEDWTYAQWYKDGRLLRNPDNYTEIVKYIWVCTGEDENEVCNWKIDDENPIAASDELKQLFEAYDKGISAYYSPRITFSMRYSSNQPIPASTLNKIGKTDTPQNAPAVGAGREWLAMGVNSDQSGDVYDVEQEWLLSGKEGWDDDFYD